MNTLPSNGTIRVVMIEDYSLFRLGVSSFINAAEGFTLVGQAENAELGLEIIEQKKPDVVLMDLGLPGMDGIEATQLLKKKHPDIGVVALTSHEDDQSVLATLACGANAYCLKDIPSDRLLEVIRTVHDGGIWLDPGVATVALKVFSKSPEMASLSSEPMPSLGERERQVLQLLSQGKNNAEIAKELYVSIHTVKAQVSTILQKLEVEDRVQAAVKAVRNNMISL
jgi:DNA-binding NarL/FixJ family response regulator